MGDTPHQPLPWVRFEDEMPQEEMEILVYGINQASTAHIIENSLWFHGDTAMENMWPLDNLPKWVTHWCLMVPPAPE